MSHVCPGTIDHWCACPVSLACMFHVSPVPCPSRKAETWFDDREICEWFGKNLQRMRAPSLRYYVRARELKAAGMDSTVVLATGDGNRRSHLAAKLVASDACVSTAERVEAFTAQGRGCRARFFNNRRKLRGGKRSVNPNDWSQSNMPTMLAGRTFGIPTEPLNAP